MCGFSSSDFARRRFARVSLSDKWPADLWFKMNPQFSITHMSREHFCSIWMHFFLFHRKHLMYAFLSTEKDLSMLFGYCINITKLIWSYEDIQIRISFPCVRLAAFSFVFKLQTAWSWKEKKSNFFTLGWILQSDEKLPWWRGLSAAFHQFRFWQSVRENRDMWSEGPFPEDSSRILVLTPSLLVPIALFWLHIAPFLKSCPSRNQDLLFWKIQGWSYPQGIRGDCGAIHSKRAIMTCPNIVPMQSVWQWPILLVIKVGRAPQRSPSQRWELAQQGQNWLKGKT